MSTPLMADCPKLKVGPVRSPKQPILIVLRSGDPFSSAWRVQENARAIRTRTAGKITFALLTEVGFFNPGIIGQVFRWTFHDYSSGLQHVCAIGMAQSCVCVLFDQENCCPLTFDLIDSFEDGMDHEGRQAQRRLVEPEQTRS